MIATLDTPEAPRRPVLRYHGGKWRIAPWVLSHFPAHAAYVEAFGGGGSILMRKDRAPGEVYNDLDGEVVNVFLVLRDPSLAEHLAREIYLTPYARDEFYASYSASDNPVEQARLTITRSFMGHGSNAITRKARHGFRSKRARSWYPSSEWAAYPEQIRIFTERLRGVVIENRDACAVMSQHDGPDVLHYVDPPYLAGTREKSQAKTSYRHEMTDEQHAELCRFLLTLQGHVVLSGYRNDVYPEILRGWGTVERDCMAEAAKRTKEVLWLSPSIQKSRRPTLPGVVL